MSSHHCNWRTVEEWSKLNVPVSTPSNEASKMYDAALSQLLSYHDDEGMGGMTTTIQKMLAADPDFVMGQCMVLNLQVFSSRSTLSTDHSFQKAVNHLMEQPQRQPHLSPSEKQHIEAVKLMSEGYMREACMKWEDILLDHPRDLLALKMAYLGHLFQGDSRQLRDSVARVLPHWSASTPYYGYILGMHAFGLEETSLYDQAEKQAAKALEISQRDCWAVHAKSHIFEMTGQQKQGIHFLDSTVRNWEDSAMLACHIWWHLAIHHVELANYEDAMEIFETQVKMRCLKQGDMFNITDAAALLFRMEMEGVKIGDQYKEIREVCEPYLGQHTAAFYDIHLVLASLGAGDQKTVQDVLESVEQFVREGQGTTRDVHQRVGLKICQALVAYREGDFAQAVDLLYPLRYEIFTIGGSHAQRDVFSLFLIMSAIQSSNKQHHKLARTLVAERQGVKQNSPMTERLMAKAVAADTD